MPFVNNEYGVGPTPPPSGIIASVINELTINQRTNPPDIATPAVPAASAFLTNTVNGSLNDVMVYILTAGAAASVTLRDPSGVAQVSALPIVAGQSIYLPQGWQIGLGAYTTAPTWSWTAV